MDASTDEEDYEYDADAVDTSDENAVHSLRVVPTDVKVGHAVGVVMERTCGHPSEEGHEFAGTSYTYSYCTIGTLCGDPTLPGRCTAHLCTSLPCREDRFPTAL